MLTALPPLDSTLQLLEHSETCLEEEMMLESVLLPVWVVTSVPEQCPTAGVQVRETQVSIMSPPGHQGHDQ